MTRLKTAKDANTSLSRLKIIRGLGMLGVVLGIGTVGYMILQGWSLLDALYMTVITITTVGYGEIREVDETGRLFTIILIFLGMGIMAYTLGIVAQAMVEVQVKTILGRRKLDLKIKAIKNHFILCGYGRMGKIVSQELASKKIPILVIDRNPESRESIEQQRIPYLIGDATSENMLAEAGIERARGLVALASSDADNLFITMSARVLNANLYILARADEESTQNKLLRAGADRVVMPYLIGGQRMAQTIIRPAVTDFLELAIHDKSMDLKMEGLLVSERSKIKGLTLIDSKIRQELDVIIVAVRKSTGDMAFNPSSQTLIEGGDTLIAMGHTANLDRLATILAGE